MVLAAGDGKGAYLSPDSLQTLEQGKENAAHSRRWFMLFLWWGTHGLVGGAVRVVFEAELIAITKSPRFDLAEADLSRLFQTGTIFCVVGKLLCGPIVAYCGVYRVGIASTLILSVIILSVSVSDTEGKPLMSVWMAWNLMRLFQTATWPATNQLLSSWFPKHEHGRAWGIMSTSSRIGILLITLTVSIRDTYSPPTIQHVFDPTIQDNGDAVQHTFFLVGMWGVLWVVVISCLLRDQPPSNKSEESGSLGSLTHSCEASHMGDEEEETAGHWRTFIKQLRSTMLRPIFLWALLAQGMATPIAEFQSQVPLTISKDSLLGPQHIGV